ncbi:MAG: GtrA family protein [Anaerolineales bacterium]|jgi:putative flippase GtrA
MTHISILSDARERTRFVKFAIVGTFGALVDFGVANLLVFAFHASLIVAGTISFICAIFSNFTWNRLWTYPDSRSKSPLTQFIQFSVTSVMGLIIRVPILKFGEPLFFRFFKSLPFQIPLLTPDFLAKNFTLAIAIIIVMFWNFFVNRYWTYNDVV